MRSRYERLVTEVSGFDCKIVMAVAVIIVTITLVGLGDSVIAPLIVALR
jgi:hypothetical protein